MLTRLGLGALLGLVLCGPVAAETLKQAIDAFDFQEYDNAREWLQPWAKKGEPDAQYRLGIMYEEGLGIQADLGKAREWYKRAADAGHAGAKKRLQKLRRSAVAGDGNKSVALDWYRENAAQGDVEAQYQLGYMYETGWGTAKDEVQAAKWYEEAASNDHVQAQLRLGLMCLTGAGVAQSRIQGTRWLRQAAENKDALAQRMLDKVLDASANLELDLQGIASRVRELSRKDTAEARLWIDREVGRARERLRKLEEKRQQALAGSRRIESTTEKTVRDVDPNFGLDARGNKTIAWYQRHAELGDAAAQFELARRYQTGDGTDLDPDQGLGWLMTAAEQGSGEARYYLAMFYYYGIGVEVNRELAREWLQKAIAAGYEQAGADAARLLLEQNAAQRESMAVWWLRQYGPEDPVARFYLGQVYEKGRGVIADRAESDKWYAAARSRALSPGEKKLARIREASLRRLQTTGGEAPEAPEALPEGERALEPMASEEGIKPNELVEFLQIDKIRENWLWLALFTLILLTVPFFIEHRHPEL